GGERQRSAGGGGAVVDAGRGRVAAGRDGVVHGGRHGAGGRQADRHRRGGDVARLALGHGGPGGGERRCGVVVGDRGRGGTAGAERPENRREPDRERLVVLVERVALDGHRDRLRAVADEQERAGRGGVVRAGRGRAVGRRPVDRDGPEAVRQRHGEGGVGRTAVAFLDRRDRPGDGHLGRRPVVVEDRGDGVVGADRGGGVGVGQVQREGLLTLGNGVADEGHGHGPLRRPRVERQRPGCRQVVEAED